MKLRNNLLRYTKSISTRDPIGILLENTWNLLTNGKKFYLYSAAFFIYKYGKWTNEMCRFVYAHMSMPVVT